MRLDCGIFQELIITISIFPPSNRLKRMHPIIVTYLTVMQILD